MTVISVVFLILELALLAVGVIVGYRRGIGRSLVRLVYLTVIGIVSFLLGRLIASRLSDTAIVAIRDALPADVRSLLTLTPEFESLVANILGALFTPIVFSLLFGLLQLLSLIGFKKLSGKLVSAIFKGQADPTQSKWAGAVLGLVMGLAVSAALLAPLFTVLHVVNSIPDQTVTIFVEAYEENGIPDLSASAPLSNTLSLQPTAFDDSLKPAFDAAKLSPWCRPLSTWLTTYRVLGSDGEKEHDSLTHSLPLIAQVAGDALYAYNFTANSGGTENDALIQAASAVIPYLEESVTVRFAAADLVSAMGKTLQNGDSFFGLSLPDSDDPLAKSIMNDLVNALAHTTADTVKDNMITLFGMPTILYDPDAHYHLPESAGLLAAMIEMDAGDSVSSLTNSGSALSLVTALAENDNMSVMLDTIREYANGVLEKNGVDLTEQQHQSAYESMIEELESDLEYYRQNADIPMEQMVEDIASTIGEGLSESAALVQHISSSPELQDSLQLQISVVAACAAKEFTSDSYTADGKVNITAKDIMSFFGIDDADIPDWARE